MLTRRVFLLASLAGCTAGLSWNGFRYFTAGDPANHALIVAPVGPKGLGQWLTDTTIERFVGAGFYVVGAHWPGVDGGDEDYGARYGEIAGWLQHLHLPRPALYAQSRGALQLLNFACDHPEAFSAIACLYPVTDPFVYPGAGEKLWAAHGVTASTFQRERFTPNLKAYRLRGKKVRIWHGDSDAMVPLASTSEAFARTSGARLTVLPGVGHQRLWLPEIAAYLQESTSLKATNQL